MFMNNRTYLVDVQILFIIKVVSQYLYSWNFLFSVLATMDKIEICDKIEIYSDSLIQASKHVQFRIKRQLPLIFYA